MSRIVLQFASLALLITGCVAPTPSAVPTAIPPENVPTVIALTAESAGLAATGTAAALNDAQLPTGTPEPTLTLTPRSTFTATTIPGHDPAAIQILAPGPMSKVVSPIQLRMNVVAGGSEQVQIDLFGEDGRLLTRTLKHVRTSRLGVPQFIQITFEIRAAAELGRITISTRDKLGRLQSLNSVRVLLLSTGSSEVNPPGNPSEPVGVFSPLPKESTSGGVLSLRGDIWPFNLQPVILELLDADGRSLGLRILTVDDIQPRLFETTIPYEIGEPVTARLTIRQDDDRIPGVFYVYSREVLLEP